MLLFDQALSNIYPEDIYSDSDGNFEEKGEGETSINMSRTSRGDNVRGFF